MPFPHPHAVPCALAALVLLALTGCPTEEPDDPEILPGQESPWYDPERLLFVEVELDPADWDELRHQTRDVYDLLEGECLAEPFESPFTYFPGTVTVDGEVREQVGVRKKGFLGSLSEEKPSLKIKFHEYVDGQTLDGIRRLTLNNGRQDPSLLKQCLGYQLFTDAGIASPRCNYAHVVVNGEDLGVFSNIESVRSPMLARSFDDEDGSLWEGTLSDFRHGWTDTFDHKDGGEDRAPLDELAGVLETAADADLVAAIEPLVDVDAFLTFWAMEALIGHWDGYAGNTNNYFVYHDPSSDQLHFLPWGIDGTFHNGNPFGEELPTVVSANGMLAHRLYQLPDVRERYVDRVKELLDTVWHEDEIVAEIDRMESLIVYAAYPGGWHDHALYIEYLRQYVKERSGIVHGELYEGIPEWDVELRGNPCFVEIGQIHAELETTWGTLDTVDPFEAGTGTMDITWDGWQVPVEFVGAVAGIDTAVADGSQAVVAGIAALPDDALMVSYILLPTAEMVPGNALGFDWIKTTALLGYAAPETGGEMVIAAYLGDGTLELQQAGTDPGDPVVFTIDGALLNSGL